MRVGDVMTRGIETTTLGSTLQAAALKMREASVGMLPVIENGRPIGIITDRDITVRATANGVDPKTGVVADAMTRAVHWCYDDEPLSEATRKMESSAIRRIIVVDRNERMVGILALDDILALPIEEQVVSAPEDAPSTRGVRRSA